MTVTRFAGFAVSTAALAGCAAARSHTSAPASTPGASAAASAQVALPSLPVPAASARQVAATAPTTAAVRYEFPVERCRVSYAHVHHDCPATDIFAARGCRVVAPIDGRVDEVTPADTWNPQTNAGASCGGRSVSIVGVDGVRHYGSHLQAVASGIHPGVTVDAGQLLGFLGDSGDARGAGTHLHFGISWPPRAGVWWVRRGEVYPWPYLDAWRLGEVRSPAAAVSALERRLGVVPACAADC